MKKQAVFFLVFFLPLAAFGSWSWVTTNTLGEMISPDWGDETRNAIKQLAADVYIDPTRISSGAASLTAPLEKLTAFFDGVTTCNSTTGRVATFPTGFNFADVDTYGIQASWQENPAGDGGDFYFTKTATQAVIFNSGSLTGKKIFYRVYRVTN